MEDQLILLESLPKAEDVIFVFYILMRVLGLLFVSPLLSNKAISATMRVYLGMFITILLTLTLYPEYRGTSPRYHLSELGMFNSTGVFAVILTSSKELAVGYVIGFLFNIVFESMVMAGELIDSMIGFSTAQFVDPFSHTFHSLLGQLMVFSGALIMLISDFHHVFIRILADSFEVIPIGDYHMNSYLLNDIILGTSWIYVFAVKYATIPIIVLSLGLVGIAFTIRVVPEMNLLLTGLPMRVLFGLWSMMLAISWIIPLFRDTFLQVSRLVERIVMEIGWG